mmetsp:Transcript_359/g.930  ORF Transcript_359/g.930 Transcript_359/m.930 type:complete len:402 (-) Transcript_359:225-1430(-)
MAGTTVHQGHLCRAVHNDHVVPGSLRSCAVEELLVDKGSNSTTSHPSRNRAHGACARDHSPACPLRRHLAPGGVVTPLDEVLVDDVAADRLAQSLWLGLRGAVTGVRTRWTLAMRATCGELAERPATTTVDASFSNRPAPVRHLAADGVALLRIDIPARARPGAKSKILRVAINLQTAGEIVRHVENHTRGRVAGLAENLPPAVPTHGPLFGVPLGEHVRAAGACSSAREHAQKSSDCHASLELWIAHLGHGRSQVLVLDGVHDVNLCATGRGAREVFVEVLQEGLRVGIVSHVHESYSQIPVLLCHRLLNTADYLLLIVGLTGCDHEHGDWLTVASRRGALEGHVQCLGHPTRPRRVMSRHHAMHRIRVCYVSVSVNTSTGTRKTIHIDAIWVNFRNLLR